MRRAPRPRDLDRSSGSKSRDSLMELSDGSDHILLLFQPQLRKHGQRQHFPRRPLGLRKIPFPISEIGKATLQMQRNGIVNLAADAPVREESPQIVAPLD